MRFSKRGLCAGQHAEPLADQKCFLEAVSHPGQVNTAVFFRARTLGPEPCRSLRPKHV